MKERRTGGVGRELNEAAEQQCTGSKKGQLPKSFPDSLAEAGGRRRGTATRTREIRESRTGCCSDETDERPVDRDGFEEVDQRSRETMGAMMRRQWRVQ
jgi:hypothetical protein